MTQIETLAIGDELLTGKISDTNSAFVAGKLFEDGLRLHRSTVVLDDVPDIQRAIREIAKRSQSCVCFGGLGPTSDDKTAACIADLLGGRVITHPESEARLLKSLKERNRPITPQAMKQVLYPEATSPIINLAGAATGFHFDLDGCRFYFTPGVPSEMKAMFANHVLPDILARAGGDRLLSHVWKCLDIPESELQRVMDPIEAALPSNAWLGYRTRFPENHLTLYWRVTGDDAEYETFRSRIREILQPFTYAEGARELEEILLDLLKEKSATLALAESCTGGLVAERLTRVAGASQNFWGSFVVYQIDAKAKMLGVELASPERAVAAETTRRLAESARKKSGCTLGAAITGYMGPGGGTEADPVGTVYLCVIGERVIERRLALWARDRQVLQWGAATWLLSAVKNVL